MDAQSGALLFSIATLIISLWTRASIAELNSKIQEREQRLIEKLRAEFQPRELCRLNHPLTKGD